MAGWLREIGMDPATAVRLGQALAPGATRPGAGDGGRAPDHRGTHAARRADRQQLADRPSRQAHERRSRDRGRGAMLGLLWNPKEISTYDVAFVDGNGAPLDGGNRYVIQFSPAAAGQRLLVADDVLGRDADLRAQCDRPLLGRRSHEGHRVR